MTGPATVGLDFMILALGKAANHVPIDVQHAQVKHRVSHAPLEPLEVLPVKPVIVILDIMMTDITQSAKVH